MDTLKDNPRKTNLWHLLHVSTGYSKVYCRKVINGDRNPHAKGAKKIVAKYNELKKILQHEN